MLWRPITANEFADQDNNDATARRDGWSTVFATPNHPDYPSGHATISAAASVALGSVFGQRMPFSITTIDPAATVRTRTYDSFAPASGEVDDSRVYAGIHFRSAVRDGQTLAAPSHTRSSPLRFARYDRRDGLPARRGAP